MQRLPSPDAYHSISSPRQLWEAGAVQRPISQMEVPRHREVQKCGRARSEERVQPGLESRLCGLRVPIFTTVLFSP